MIEAIPVNEHSVLAYRVRGRVTEDEYRQFAATLEQRLRDCGYLSLFIELQDFDGFEPAVAWDDLRFGLKHDWDFKRIAVVGHGQFQRASVALANAFTHIELRFFEQEQASDAWSWLEESESETSAAVEPVPYRNVLLASDFSPCSERAAARALELAERYSADLHVLHVVREIASDLAWYVPPESQITLADEPMMKRAADSLSKFAARTGLDGRAGLHLESGHPIWSVLSWAREHDVDLIVLGSHGRHGVRRLLGSVSSGVVRHASCEVLVVKG